MRALNKQKIKELFNEAAKLEQDVVTAHQQGFLQGAHAVLNTMDLFKQGYSVDDVVQETGLSREFVRCIAVKVNDSNPM